MVGCTAAELVRRLRDQGRRSGAGDESGGGGGGGSGSAGGRSGTERSRGRGGGSGCIGPWRIGRWRVLMVAAALALTLASAFGHDATTATATSASTNATSATSATSASASTNLNATATVSASSSIASGNTLSNSSAALGAAYTIPPNATVPAIPITAPTTVPTASTEEVRSSCLAHARHIRRLTAQNSKSDSGKAERSIFGLGTIEPVVVGGGDQAAAKVREELSRVSGGGGGGGKNGGKKASSKCGLDPHLASKAVRPPLQEWNLHERVRNATKVQWSCVSVGL